MMNVMVILLFLFNCVDGDVHVANALLPLAAAHVSSSSLIANSSQLMQRITADPKVFVSELASADPTVILTVIGMLEQLIAEGDTAKTGFERNEDAARIDKDAKTITHDELLEIVVGLTTSINQLSEDRIVAVRNAGVAGAAKEAAIQHHTAMVNVRDENLPVLASEKASLENIIVLLQEMTPPNSNYELVGNGWCLNGNNRVGMRAMWRNTNVRADNGAGECEELCDADASCIGYQTEDDVKCQLMPGPEWGQPYTEINGVDSERRNWCWEKK